MKIKMTFEQEFDSDEFYEFGAEITQEEFIEDICEYLEIYDIIDKAKFKQINED